MSLFSPNTGKYGPEKTPYLDIFRAVPLPHHCFIPVTTTPHALPENFRKPKVLRGYRDEHLLEIILVGVQSILLVIGLW